MEQLSAFQRTPSEFLAKIGPYIRDWAAETAWCLELQIGGFDRGVPLRNIRGDGFLEFLRA